MPPDSEPLGYPVKRVEIGPKGQSAPLTGLTFDWEVNSGKVRGGIPRVAVRALDSLAKDKYVRMAQSRPNLLPITHPWSLSRSPLGSSVFYSDPDLPGVMTNQKPKQFTIDYSFTVADGYIEVEFRNRPAEGNFAGVFFVIEEQVNSDLQGNPGPIIRTLKDISMVGVELHLPQEYFDYIDLCKKRQSAIIDEINRKHIAANVPVPRWDPYRYESVSDWVREVLKQNPRLLKGELLKEAKKLAQTRVPSRQG